VFYLLTLVLKHATKSYTRPLCAITPMINQKYNILVRIVLIITLSLCLFDMPYGYYQFVRIASFLGFGFFAYLEYQDKKYYTFLIYMIGVILFNPIEKINLGRELWQIVDVIFSIFLFITVVIKRKHFFSKKNQ
jgi:hypothetical protein